MHALTGCDTVSYPYRKGKGTACKILKKYELTQMDKIGDVNATQEELLAASKEFFLLLYGQRRGKVTNLNHARCNIYKKKKKKLV